MAAFGDISSKIGYDIMSPMYQALGGSGNPFAMDMGEGNPWLLGADQATTLGQFDPSMFNGIDFNWQGKGPGNSGTLSASRGGNTLGSWSQYDTPFGETLLDALMTAGAAFGGLGLAGAGPWSGLADLFGAGAAGAGEAAAAGAAEASPYALSGGSFGTSGAIGSTGMPALGVAGAGAAPGGLVSTGAGLGIGSTGAALGASGIGAGLGATLAESTLPAGFGVSGPGLSVPGFSQPAAAGPYELSGAKFGSSGATGGLTSTGNGLAVGNSATAGATMGKSAGGLSSYVDKLLSPKGMGKVVPGVMQAYSGIQQRNNAKKLMGQLTGLGKAGGPYELALRKQLERRDAAAGRRSQYGPREVELQAKLAELMTRNGGTLAQLMQQQQGGSNAALQGLYFGGRSLLDLFGG